MEAFGSFFKKMKNFVVPADIQIFLSGEAQAIKIKNPLDPEKPKLPVYLAPEPIKGNVTITPLDNKKIDHDGITVY
jgi:hypothetical protein